MTIQAELLDKCQIQLIKIRAEQRELMRDFEMRFKSGIPDSVFFHSRAEVHATLMQLRNIELALNGFENELRLTSQMPSPRLMQISSEVHTIEMRSMARRIENERRQMAYSQNEKPGCNIL